MPRNWMSWVVISGMSLACGPVGLDDKKDGRESFRFQEVAVTHPSSPSAEVSLFDGSSTAGWRMVGEGRFEHRGDTLVGIPGNGLGLLWNEHPTPPDYVLELEWSLSSPDDNSGIFVRFPNPEGRGYENPAWYAVHHGYEIQIDELARPDGADVHRTGAVYNEKGQFFRKVTARPPGEWNQQRIEVQGRRITVHINGERVSDFEGPPGRGEAGDAEEPRFIGLQTHTGSVAFRNVRLRPLPPVTGQRDSTGTSAALRPNSELPLLKAPLQRTFLTEPRRMMTGHFDNWYLAPIFRPRGRLEGTTLHVEARWCDRLLGQNVPGFDRQEQLVMRWPRATPTGIVWEAATPKWLGRTGQLFVDSSFDVDVYEWRIEGVDEATLRQHGLAFAAELNVGTYWAQVPGDNWNLPSP